MINIQGNRHPLQGFVGGSGGAGNWAIVDWQGPNETRIDEVAINYESQPGEMILYQSGGGGGWGSPLDRDPEAVLMDIRNDLVSIEGARRDYGVVVDPEKMVVLEDATKALRAEMA